MVNNIINYFSYFSSILNSSFSPFRLSAAVISKCSIDNEPDLVLMPLSVTPVLINTACSVKNKSLS